MSTHAPLTPSAPPLFADSLRCVVATSGRNLHCTLAQFIAGNRDGLIPNEIETMRLALSMGGTFRGMIGHTSFKISVDDSATSSKGAS